MTAHENAGPSIRSTAELLISNAPSMSHRLGASTSYMPPGFDISRTHSINLITDEFLGGYMQDGRMSVIRRFFCLFVTFDLIFVSLLWLICTMINGESIYQAFQKQIVHYTIYTSLFDVVGAALFRFIFLIFFYAILYVNHWLVIALSTSGSCLFLISKVFVFDWVDSSQQVFQVILILTSFVLAWGEAWFLDCRVIPQERHARHYFNSVTSNDRSPLLAPFLASQEGHRTIESASNFYSPFDSAPNSDDEEEQDEEYHRMGLDCVRKVSELLDSNEWRVDKVTSKGDTIHCMQRENLGKIYKLTAHLKYPAKLLLEELFYKVEDVPKWNPTVLESKVVKKINSYTDISYQVSASVGGGIVKSRDFINLRCWRVICNGGFLNAREIEQLNSDEENALNRSCEGSVSTISDGGDYQHFQSGSVGSGRLSSGYNSNLDNQHTFNTLSKSLGARGFTNSSSDRKPPPLIFEDPPPLDDTFQDARDVERNRGFTKDHIWISAAISIPYDSVPPSQKNIRGENLVTGFALREIVGKPDVCIMEWVLCLDLKGYIPRYVLDTAYTTFMSDYMVHLRKYIHELKQNRIKPQKKK